MEFLEIKKSRLLINNLKLLPFKVTYMVTRTRIELMIPPWEGGVLAAWPTGLIKCFYIVS